MRTLKWLRVTAVALFLFLLLILILIASGHFDPQPLGSLIDQQNLQRVVVPPNSNQLQTWQRPLPETPYSIRLTAALQSGEQNSGYGLLLGSAEHQLGVAVSPLGTLAVWETQPQALFHLPWQTWPHVRLNYTVNEIWLDVADDQLTVRINRELLWVGQVSELGGTVTLWTESWGDTAVVDFQLIQLFTTP